MTHSRTAPPHRPVGGRRARGGTGAQGWQDYDAGELRAGGPGRAGRSARRTASRQAARRRRRRRLLLTVSVLALVLALGSSYAYFKLNANISSVAVGDKIGSDAERPAESPPGAMNILLFGSDSREGANAAYGTTEGARSDTTMLVHVYKGGEKAVAVSIPRDTMLRIPSCERDDGTSTSVQAKAQFNTALSTGGPACVWKTVEALSGLRLDHFVQVDFTGFKDMTAAVGGVQVCLPYAVKDKDSGLNLPAGNSTVEGEQALAFVRNRHGVGDGSDLARIQMQQQFMSSLLQKTVSAGTLADPLKVLPLANAATKAITTDEGLGSVPKLTSLALQLKDLRPADLQFVTLPTAGDPADPNRLVPVAAQGKALWGALAEDQPLTADPTGAASPATPAPAAPAVQPADVRVKVLNGSGVSGAAAKAAEALKALGYTVTGTGNAPSTVTTTIAASDTAQGDALKAALAVPAQVADGSGTTVTLTLGSDFAGVAAPTAAAPVDTSVTEQLVARNAGEDICAKNPSKGRKR